jgi:hypothetical protein
MKIGETIKAKKRETNNRICVVSAIWNRPFHVAWYLQNIENDLCSIFELQPCIFAWRLSMLRNN